MEGLTTGSMLVIVKVLSTHVLYKNREIVKVRPLRLSGILYL